jgi:spore germination cell wall hydrolase CwlJ-like protein
LWWHEVRERLRPSLRYVAAAIFLVAADFAASSAPLVVDLVDAIKLSVARSQPEPPPSAPGKATGAAARRSDPEPAAPTTTDGDLAFVASAADPLPPPPFSPEERECLARAVYFEGRGETVEGQIAVAQIVMNRLSDGRWPGTICGVVYQGVERGEKCQFSFACTDARRRIAGAAGWEQAAWIADDVAAGRAYLSELRGAVFFHTTAVKPVWRLSLTPVRTIGRHVFYREREGFRLGVPRVAGGVAPVAAGPRPPARPDGAGAGARPPRAVRRTEGDFVSETMDRLRHGAN